jgi:uncharacterized protein (TIGR02270 family)
MQTMRIEAGSASMRQSSVIPVVIEQHADELATLWTSRDGLRAAGHVALRHLARFDERIAAHQDGCVVAGHDGLRVLNAQLATVSSGRLFAAGVVAFDLNDRGTVTRCLALAEAVPDARRGMTSALGWVASDRLRGIVKDMLTAQSAVLRSLGLAACRLHVVEPGPALFAGLKDSSAEVRAEAFRGAGVLGQTDLTSSLAAVVDEDAACQFWSAWSAVLLGDRGRGLNTLTNVALTAGDNRRRAFLLSCQAMSPAAAHAVLARLRVDPTQMRSLIEGAGVVGDPHYVPWLVTQMADDNLARLAGEAFTLITGADLALLDLERKPPENFRSGPNDDPDDSNVGMDADDGLPWPAQARVRAWWDANGNRFHPGVRYFMGAPLTREHCVDVLKNGGQRQRLLAAHYLCLLEPGTALFNTSARALRQQVLLAQM